MKGKVFSTLKDVIFLFFIDDACGFNVKIIAL